MGYQFSLAYLTIQETKPPEAVKIAARCGYSYVGLRLLPSATEGPFALMNDYRILAETKAVLVDTGVKVADIEIIRIGEFFNLASTERFLAIGAELGSKHIVVAGDDENLDRCADNYAAFCELSSRYAMTADLEFMPWTMVPDITAAKLVVEKAQQPSNSGVLIDALHLDRSSTTLQQIAEMDPALIHYVQFCDALSEFEPSHEQLIAIARGARLNPGEGNLDLKGLLSVIPADCLLSIEVPHLVRAQTYSPMERAQNAIDAMKRLIAQ